MAFLLAYNGKACATRLGLVAEKQESPRTSSIYTTDIWSGSMKITKYKKRDTNDNKRRCKIWNAKCEIRVAIATTNMNVIPSYICFLPSLYLFSPFF